MSDPRDKDVRLTEPTIEMVAVCLQTFRQEIDRHMDLRHPSSSPGHDAMHIALRKMLAAVPLAPAHPEAAQEGVVVRRRVEYDDALNEAGWAFTEAYVQHFGEPVPGRLFNHTKPLLKVAIEKYLARQSAAPAQVGDADKAKLLEALEQIRDTPYSMVNDSEGLRFTLRQIGSIAIAAIAAAGEGR